MLQSQETRLPYGVLANLNTVIGIVVVQANRTIDDGTRYGPWATIQRDADWHTELTRTLAGAR